MSILSLALLGMALGAGLGVAAKKFAVRRDEREVAAMETLPGANCGACGFPGCQAFASSLVRGDCPVNGCLPGGDDVHSKLAEIMGVEHNKSEPMAAVVKCSGTKDAAKDKFEYRGLERCSAAALLSGGRKACPYGCLGYGDCVRACPFGAISMGEDGLPHIDSAKCSTCGLCVGACPKNLIELIPEKQKIYAACASPDKGKNVKEVCSAGCIGCGICARFAPGGSIKMQENLPVFTGFEGDFDKALAKCPVKVLKKRN